MRRLPAKTPHRTITVATLAIVIALSPMLQRALVFDRNAVVRGQLWRVATANLVHFSPSHLLYDLIVVTIAGVLLERRGWPVAAIVAGSGIAVGIAVLSLEPTLATYGGLSGIACTLAVIAALDSARSSGLTRATGIAFLLLVAVKLWWEWRSGSFVFVSAATANIRPVPLAHVIGSGVGVGSWLARRFVHRPGASLRQSAMALSPVPARGPGSRS